MVTSLGQLFSEMDDEWTESAAAVAVRQYLEGNGTAESAVENILMSPTDGDSPPETLDDVIIEVAAQLPETHEVLLSLLRELKKHSQTSDFGNLKYLLREKWRDYRGDLDPSESCRSDIRNEWVNLNHFAALIHKSGIENLSYLAMDTIEMALRRKAWPVSWNDQNTTDTLGALDHCAPAAAQWIIECGKRLYDESSDVKSRWVAWREDLEWIVGTGELYEANQAICERAVFEMRKITM